jgi:ankyrin repeat protein
MEGQRCTRRQGGHEAVIRLLLELRADINAWDNKGRTALHHAAGEGHKAVVRLLLELGHRADVNTMDNIGLSGRERGRGGSAAAASA